MADLIPKSCFLILQHDEIQCEGEKRKSYLNILVNVENERGLAEIEGYLLSGRP